jgi:sulfonate transport system ATP-binding protein
MAIDAITAPSPASPATTAPVVTTRHLERAFDGRGVLTDVTFSIDRGEFVALLGRSGSGKSTLLRILAKLDRDYTGELLAPRLPSVAFQDSRLLPWARVLPNVLLGLPTRGAEGSAARVRAEQLLADVGLEDKAKEWPKTLSGGETQRVSLARALVREPSLLLMDEPFGALDALTRIRMHRLLRLLCERYGPAVLLVTHDVDEAILLADRILVLTDGHLSLDVRVDMPEQDRRRNPRFIELRRQLLTELGVADDDQ